MSDRLNDAAELLDKWVITWPYRTDRVLAVLLREVAAAEKDANHHRALLRVTAAAHHVADVVLGEVAL